MQISVNHYRLLLKIDEVDLINMEDKDYYHSLSRRGLQDLCRKNGLPVSKTKSHLAKSLASRYQSTNVTSAALGERSSSLMNGPLTTSPTLNVESGLNPMGETNKGKRDIRGQAVDMNNQRSSTPTKRLPVSTKLMPMDPSVKGDEEVHGCSNFDNQETAGCSLLGFRCPDVRHRFGKKDNSDLVEARDFNQEMVDASRKIRWPNISQSQCRDIELFKVPTNIDNTELGPTFEYYVGSENGINLEVDLSSSQSDWIKKLNDGVRIHSEDPDNKPWALHEELRNLGGGCEEVKAASLGNGEVECTNKCDLTLEKSSLDLLAEEDSSHVKVDQSSRIDRSSMPPAVTQNNTPVEISGLVGTKDQPKSSSSEQNVEVQKSNVWIEQSTQSSQEIDLTSEAPDTSQIKSTGGHVMGSKSGSLKSLSSQEEQSECVKTCPENTETRSVGASTVPHVRGILSYTEFPETINLITGIRENGNRPLSGGLTSGDSMDMQLSEVTSLSKNMSYLSHKNGGRLDLDNLMHGPQTEIESSAKCDLDLNKSLDPSSVCPDEQRRSNLPNEMQSSECSQFDVRAKNSKRSISVGSEGLHNKRQHSHAEDSSSPSVKILRKGRGRNIYPRRSKRLVSK